MKVRDRLDLIQQEQQKYDHLYHRDACALPIEQRATHMTLLFFKYSGLIAKSRSHYDTEILNNAIADTFINCFAFASMFDYSLSDKIPFADYDRIVTLEDLGKILSYCAEYNFNESFCLNQSLAIPIGHLAKIYLSLDHVDAYFYREEIIDNVAAISSATLVAAYKRDIKMQTHVHYRLTTAEVNSIFRQKNGVTTPLAEETTEGEAGRSHQITSYRT